MRSWLVYHKLCQHFIRKIHINRLKTFNNKEECDSIRGLYIIMPIKITIHSIDTNSNNAIISLHDGSVALSENQNLRIEMNPDGSANTQWLKTYAKYFAFHKRLVRLDNIEDDLL